MGYGARTLSLLKMYYEFLIPNIEDDKLPKENIDSIQEDEVNLLEERIGILILFCNIIFLLFNHCFKL